MNRLSLTICNDLTLKNQLSKEKSHARKELRTCCEQLIWASSLIAPQETRETKY